MTPTMIVFTGWLILAAIFFQLWRVAQRQSNAGWVDVGWSLSFAVLIIWYAVHSDGSAARRALFAVLATVWGLRLGLHILLRLLRECEEDGRYAHLRQHWGAQAHRKFFWFFQGQAVANLLLALPVLVLMQARPTVGLLGSGATAITWFDVAGVVWMLLAIAGEASADRQLARWKAVPANRGKTCRRGWWALSRHPNYFFEWLHWLAYPVFGLALLVSGMWLGAALTLLAPVIMLVLLMRVTGIPYTEQRALRTRGDDYRRYQREVSAFFPWLPKGSKRTHSPN